MQVVALVASIDARDLAAGAGQLLAAAAIPLPGARIRCFLTLRCKWARDNDTSAGQVSPQSIQNARSCNAPACISGCHRPAEVGVLLQLLLLRDCCATARARRTTPPAPGMAERLGRPSRTPTATRADTVWWWYAAHTLQQRTSCGRPETRRWSVTSKTIALHASISSAIWYRIS
jgi:hypothetical protein